MHFPAFLSRRIRFIVFSTVLVGSPFLHAADLEDYGPLQAVPVVSSGLNQPLYVTAAPGDRDRLFIVQKGGFIRIFDRQANALLPSPFLTISSLTTNSERGLLGLAFHPKFDENGFLFIHYTNTGGHSVIRRYRVDPDNPNAVLPGSALNLMTVNQPFANHNAGWLDFSPVDGFLYIAMGDGGSGNDPQNHGQNRNTLLGAMLRIDVDRDDFPTDNSRNYGIPSGNPFVDAAGADEIWAYGLRNPWRNSFDRETGDLWIADVGQGAREEVNFQAAGAGGGQNYGWRLREGTIATPGGGVGGARPPGNVDPIYEYDFSDGRKAISGGYVYRGEAMPQLRGHYFFADSEADFVKSFAYGGEAMVPEGEVVDWTPMIGTISRPVSFGEDADGELYVVSLFGTVYQLTQAPWYLWRNRHFESAAIADPAISGEAAAPAGDGVPNLVKHALGLAAMEPVAALPWTVGVEDHDGTPALTVSLDRDAAANDVNLVVEVSGDLSDPGGWVPAEVVESSPEHLVARDPLPAGDAVKRFARLRATRSD